MNAFTYTIPFFIYFLSYRELNTEFGKQFLYKVTTPSCGRFININHWCFIGRLLNASFCKNTYKQLQKLIFKGLFNVSII